MAGRGSKPGEHRGGRKAGTPNKDRRELYDMLRDKFGDDFDPVVEAAQLSVDLKGNMEPDAIGQRLKALALVAKYTRPTLRSVEYKDNTPAEDSNITIEFVNADSFRSACEIVHSDPLNDGGSG